MTGKKGMLIMETHRKEKCILLFVLCCFALLLVGCSSSADSEMELPAPSFKEGEPHSNAVAFRLWFEVMTSAAGPCTVSVQDTIYDEKQATEWWYAIQSDQHTEPGPKFDRGRLYAVYHLHR